MALKEETNHKRGIDRHLYKKESTAGGIDRLPCSRICSSLVSLYYKLGTQKVPPRAFVPRIRSSRCIYRRAITIRSNIVSESLTIPFVFVRDIHRRSIQLFHINAPFGELTLFRQNLGLLLVKRLFEHFACYHILDVGS